MNTRATQHTRTRGNHSDQTTLNKSPSRRQCLQWGAASALTALPFAPLSPLAAFASRAHAASSDLLLPSSELTYDLEGMQNGLRYKASATLRWQRNTQAYEAELSARILIVFKRRQLSQGVLSAFALRPQRFTDEGKRIRQASFDASNQRIDYTESGPAPWNEHAQDRLSIYFMLPQLMAQARLHQHNTITLPVSSANSLSTWQLRLDGRDAITTPMGSYSAQRISRVAQAANDTQATLWFGGAQDVLPLRIRLEDGDGTWLEQSLASQRRLDDLPQG
jgi:hypothetical protein